MMSEITVKDVQKKVPGLKKRAASNRLKLFANDKITEEQLFRKKGRGAGKRVKDGWRLTIARLQNKKKQWRGYDRWVILRKIDGKK